MLHSSNWKKQPTLQLSNEDTSKGVNDQCKTIICAYKLVTAKGHMNQKQQGPQSTKCTPTMTQTLGECTNFVTTNATSIIYINQTGNFPVKDKKTS